MPPEPSVMYPSCTRLALLSSRSLNWQRRPPRSSHPGGSTRALPSVDSVRSSPRGGGRIMTMEDRYHARGRHKARRSPGSGPQPTARPASPSTLGRESSDRPLAPWSLSIHRVERIEMTMFEDAELGADTEHARPQARHSASSCGGDRLRHGRRCVPVPARRGALAPAAFLNPPGSSRGLRGIRRLIAVQWFSATTECGVDRDAARDGRRAARPASRNQMASRKLTEQIRRALTTRDSYVQVRICAKDVPGEHLALGQGARGATSSASYSVRAGGTGCSLAPSVRIRRAA
jgi:hypothetical protein